MTYKEQESNNHLNRLKLVVTACNDAKPNPITIANLCSPLIREQRYLLHTQKFHDALLGGENTVKKKGMQSLSRYVSKPRIEKQTVHVSFKLKMSWITSKHGVLSKCFDRL